MRIAITGGTGFIGRHLARQLAAEGHQIRLIARGADRRDPAIRDLPGAALVLTDLRSADELARAFAGCDAVAHCAGINREVGTQTFEAVHVEGTRNVVAAARRAGVRKIALLSFLRARPDCGSPYHESKWAAEEIVRSSELDFTVLKCGMIYGRGDHMLDHLSHALHAMPLFAAVGFYEKPCRPLAIDDLIDVLHASLVGGRLSHQTVAVLGAEELLLSDAVRRISRVIGRRVLIVPLPVWSHYALAWIFEKTMKVPLIARAQVRILAEGVTGAAPSADPLPRDLAPRRMFTDDQIRRGLPEPGPFGLHDLRCCSRG
jgi:NADH dehydrogenase